MRRRKSEGAIIALPYCGTGRAGTKKEKKLGGDAPGSVAVASQGLGARGWFDTPTKWSRHECPLTPAQRAALESVHLDDKYTLIAGRAWMSGIHALCACP